jgi:hypothetical protein
MMTLAEMPAVDQRPSERMLIFAVDRHLGHCLGAILRDEDAHPAIPR